MSWRTATVQQQYTWYEHEERPLPTLSRQYPTRLDVSEMTTGRQLQRILHYSITPSRSLSTFRRSECVLHDVDCDEVYPNVYIGDVASAKNKNFLRMMGITHVLNTAEGSRYGQVDTGHSYYRDMTTLRYMGFPMLDQPSTDISRYFYIASKFIENGVNSGGKVLVHCLVGMSRSATCVLAYLMISRKMSAMEAIRTVRMHRDIRPNDGFLQQLADLDNELKRERMYYGYGTTTIPSSTYSYIREHSVPLIDEPTDYYLPNALPMPSYTGFPAYPYHEKISRGCDLGTRIRIRADIQKKQNKERK